MQGAVSAERAKAEAKRVYLMAASSTIGDAKRKAMTGVRTGISCQPNRMPTRSCRLSVAAPTRTASCNSY